MDRAKFYAALRKRDSGVFGTSLSQRQVEGIENLLDVWEKYFFDGHADELAYDLGTAYHETAHTMQPITERGSRRYFDKYEPGTRIGKVLGNTQPGDGYRYRGEGHVMNTGRRNARKATNALNRAFHLGVDLVRTPSQRGDPLVSALSLFLGNREGWWTGREIDDYLDHVRETDDEDLREFMAARRIVNGTDRAALIARYAMAFRSALDAAGYNPAHEPAGAQKPIPVPTPRPDHKTPPAAKHGGKTALGVIVAAILAIVWNWWDGVVAWVHSIF